MIKKNKYIFCGLFLLSLFFCQAQEDGGAKLRNTRSNPRVKTRISFSPIIGFYKTNKYHASKGRQKMAFCISVREEIRLDKKNRAFVMIGAEYLLHGLSFNSYYFKPDSIKLYNGNMSAKYNLVVHELVFPIQLKYSLQRETNTIFSKYLFAGYCYRWIVDSKLKVANNGEDIIEQPGHLKFKLPAFNPVTSSFFCAGFGIQKNKFINYNAVFAEIQFRYALSPFYFNESYAPTNSFINSHFLNITVGFKI